MKNIIINIEKLPEMLENAQRRAKVRTITVQDIEKALAEITAKLEPLTTSTDAVHTWVKVDIQAQHFPSAYRGRPESTWFMATYTAKGWRVDKVYRNETLNRSGSNVVLHLSDAAKDNMISYLTRHIAV